MTPSQDILKPLDNNDNRSGVMKLAPIVKMDTNIVMSNDSINVNQIDILPAEVHTVNYRKCLEFFFSLKEMLFVLFGVKLVFSWIYFVGVINIIGSCGFYHKFL